MTRLATKVLVPTDLSDASLLALDTAALVARQNDAELELMYVLTESNAECGHDAALPSGLEAVLAERAPGLRTSARAVKCRTAAEGICHHAAKVSADLIVIATEGRTGRAHSLTGSVAEEVVRLATCPVLSVRR